MPGDDEPGDADAAWRELAALGRAQVALQALVVQAAESAEPWPGAALAWELQERLERLLWHLHRAEAGLRGWRRHGVRAAPAPAAPVDDGFVRWRDRLDAAVAARAIATAYRFIAEPLDLDAEAATGDAVTDLALACACAQRTAPVLDRIAASRDRAGLDHLAADGVIAPWRIHGAPAALRALTWLQALRIEADDW